MLKGEEFGVREALLPCASPAGVLLSGVHPSKCFRPSGSSICPFVHLSGPPGCIHLAASGQRPVVLASEAGGGRQAMEPERRCL